MVIMMIIMILILMILIMIIMIMPMIRLGREDLHRELVCSVSNTNLTRASIMALHIDMNCEFIDLLYYRYLSILTLPDRDSTA